jgi:hypothetical protein
MLVPAAEAPPVQPQVPAGALAKIKPDRKVAVDERTIHELIVSLDRTTFTRPPKIHNFPAPPAIPPLGDDVLIHSLPPEDLLVARRRRASVLGRLLNSTIGRSTLFCSTIVAFNVCIYGLVNYGNPEYVKEGTSHIHFFIFLSLMLLMYTFPLIAERAGMKSSETGWKPYLAMYRCAFLLAIFAIAFNILGAGQRNWNGKRAGTKLRIEQLSNQYWNWFELADGFVALNLTKGVTETLQPEEHGPPNHRRKSRFRDTELRVNHEPYADAVDPTPTPGTISTYRIAPIFANWAYCATRYRISTNCLTQNAVRAWAISKSSSLCSSSKSVACLPPKPLLEPVYKCTQNGGVPGGVNVTGICGRVTLPPPEGAVDELGALMLYDAWPKISLPKSSDLWIDVSPDECISDPQSCEDTWSRLALIGLIFQILTNLCFFLPCFQDCKTDYRIRAAMTFMEEQEKIKAAYEASSRRQAV